QPRRRRPEHALPRIRRVRARTELCRGRTAKSYQRLFFRSSQPRESVMNFVPQQLTVSADAVDTVAMQVEQALARIRTHRFIADAHNGRLSQDQATRWVMCAGRESRSFPQILKGMI